jgi:hypothetical protein
MSLQAYIEKFQDLNVNRARGHASPHKVCMLLGVMDLLEDGTLRDNRIELNEALVQKFRNHFEMTRTGADQANAHLPYYHLRSDGFWHHEISPGREGAYEELRNATAPARVREAIAYAYLDSELFEYLKYSVTREQLKHALFENIDPDARADLRGAIGDWSQLECELIARDYLDMLVKELGGIAYSKAEHRRALQPHLQNRSEGSIEYKHQNISAVLIDLGLPYIRGYKPAFNYQALLASVISHHVTARRLQLERGAEESIQAPTEPVAVDWATVLEEPPEMERAANSPRAREFQPRQYNYGERESQNRRLGESGEKFVIDYEKFRLERLGRGDLAKAIEWTSKERGDGTGYDVRSFNAQSDAELFIEVKTTNSGKYQPFIISDNEVAFSEERPDQYALYRVFEFRNRPRIFTLPGKVREHVNLVVRQYVATFRQ